MDCRHRILLDNKYLLLLLHTKADYCPESTMPKIEWFYFWNYEFMIFRTKYSGKKYFKIRWNYRNKIGLFIDRTIYKIRKKLGIKYEWEKDIM